MKITTEDIKNIKLETKQDFIRALDMSIQLANQLDKCLDEYGSKMQAQTSPKAT